MRTVVLGDPPAPLEEWLEQRRARGQDRFDEEWEREYHVVPAPSARHGDIDDQLAGLLRPSARQRRLWPSGPLNLGQAGDYRVPDRAYLRERSQATYVPCAAIVVEIVSSDDETYDKFRFYFAQDVEELLVVDPTQRTVQWYGRGATGFEPTDHSDLLDLAATELDAAIDWPPT